MTRGRPRKTDPDIVLDDAMKLFWKQGYAATSMSDLVTATGMAKPGLYATFGDKEALFKKSLEHYIADFGVTWLNDLVGSVEPLAVCFRGFLEGAAAMLVDNSNPGGCFLVNCLIEGTAQSASVEALGRSFVASRQAAFARRFERGRQQGELPSDADTEALADFFSGQILALGILGRAGADIAALNRVINVAMTVLPPVSETAPS